MDTSIEKYMNVILSDGTVFKFKECGSGLYYYDMASNYPLLPFINCNREFFNTCAEVDRANRARRYQGLLGWPEKSSFETYVNNNLLLNCNINVDDINIADHLYE